MGLPFEDYASNPTAVCQYLHGGGSKTPCEMSSATGSSRICGGAGASRPEPVEQTGLLRIGYEALDESRPTNRSGGTRRLGCRPRRHDR